MIVQSGGAFHRWLMHNSPIRRYIPTVVPVVPNVMSLFTLVTRHRPIEQTSDFKPGVIVLKKSHSYKNIADIADKWLLHRDNIQHAATLSVTEFLNSKGIPVIPHPPNHFRP